MTDYKDLCQLLRTQAPRMEPEFDEAMTQAAAAIESLSASLKEAQKDAERFVFLGGHFIDISFIKPDGSKYFDVKSNSVELGSAEDLAHLRAAIDAARTPKEPTHG